MPLEEAAEGRTPQPGPPRPDGSYIHHGLRKGYVTERPVDLASWKQADYGQMAHNKHSQHARNNAIERILIGLIAIGAGVPTTILGIVVFVVVVAEHTAGLSFAGPTFGLSEMLALADTPELIGIGSLLTLAGMGMIAGGIALIASGIHDLWETSK